MKKADLHQDMAGEAWNRSRTGGDEGGACPYHGEMTLEAEVSEESLRSLGILDNLLFQSESFLGERSDLKV